MANVKISELSQVTTLDNNDVLPVVNDGETKKVTVQQIVDSVPISNGTGNKSAVIGSSTNEANGNYSVAMGTHTKASGIEQVVSGTYNVEDTENKYTEIVGGGNSTTPKILEHSTNKVMGILQALLRLLHLLQMMTLRQKAMLMDIQQVEHLFF